MTALTPKFSEIQERRCNLRQVCFEEFCEAIRGALTSINASRRVRDGLKFKGSPPQLQQRGWSRMCLRVQFVGPRFSGWGLRALSRWVQGLGAGCQFRVRGKNGADTPFSLIRLMRSASRTTQLLETASFMSVDSQGDNNKGAVVRECVHLESQTFLQQGLLVLHVIGGSTEASKFGAAVQTFGQPCQCMSGLQSRKTATSSEIQGVGPQTV